MFAGDTSDISLEFLDNQTWIRLLYLAVEIELLSCDYRGFILLDSTLSTYYSWLKAPGIKRKYMIFKIHGCFT
jgi:hypothetical protein